MRDINPKNILGNIHKKTHFKAVKCSAIKAPSNYYLNVMIVFFSSEKNVMEKYEYFERD